MIIRCPVNTSAFIGAIHPIDCPGIVGGWFTPAKSASSPLSHVEAFGTIDIGHRMDDNIEFHIDSQRSGIKLLVH